MLTSASLCVAACEYRGLTHSDSEPFPSPDDACTTCVCARGSVTCTRTPCPALACSHPEEGACCPLCVGCLYASRRYRTGQHFASPLDSCASCACRRGNVTCAPRRCPEVACSHPVRGACCPLCADCAVAGGKRVSDGSRFSHATDPCQICSCQVETFCQLVTILVVKDSLN